MSHSIGYYLLAVAGIDIIDNYGMQCVTCACALAS